MKAVSGAALAAAAALFSGVLNAAAQDCAGDLPPVCLQSFGAGSAAISPAASEAGCSSRLQSYRDCISQLATQKGLASDKTPLSRAERGFLSALEAELADNVGRLEVFVAEKMDLTGSKAIYENQWPALRTRFFNSTEHPAYFSAPADWLARTQGFYDDLQSVLSSENIRHAYRRQSSSVLYERRIAREQVEALVALGRNQLLPEISSVLTEGR